MLNYKSSFLSSHLITYIGNKRKLLPFINDAVEDVKNYCNKNKLTIFDGFSGSGSVARLLKYNAEKLYVNDIENYSKTLNLCYLANMSEINFEKIKYYIDLLNSTKLDKTFKKGLIELNYAPKDDNNIQKGERVFYTNRNAKIIDNIRRKINEIDDVDIAPFLLAPLLIKASICTNTSGVFKGFHKKNGIGHFGGKNENALSRILSEINLEYPVFCENECPVYIYSEDTNKVVKNFSSEIDLAYYDPPYNSHPYGSNYFMLNIINDYNDPEISNGISGIVTNWNKSAYNYKKQAENAMEQLIKHTNAKYILLSYNNEGIISENILKQILEKYGKVELRKKLHNTYRGSRNFGKNKILNSGQIKNTYVEELLWLVKKEK